MFNETLLFLYSAVNTLEVGRLFEGHTDLRSNSVVSLHSEL